MPLPVNATLIEAWMRARSVARGLPQPVPDRGGLRLETGLLHETRRYVFMHATGRLRELAEDTREPRIFLKLCDTDETLRAHVPARWRVSPQNFVMTCKDSFAHLGDRTRLPEGLRLEVKTDSAVTHATILSETGEVAASGYAAEYAGVFAYDRIQTVEAHRRKGLGTVIMTALAAARRSSTTPQILAATAAGRALYQALGWSDYTPYTTAVIPNQQECEL